LELGCKLTIEIFSQYIFDLITCLMKLMYKPTKR
jgi:hypothetical protein